MNLNQFTKYEYKNQCRSSFTGIISIIDKLLVGNFDWVDEEINGIPAQFRFSDIPDWSGQINRYHVDPFIDKYCNIDYYGILTTKIRKYKIEKNRTSLV